MKSKNKTVKDLTLDKASKAVVIHNSLWLEATTPPEKREKTNKHNHLAS